MQSTLLNVKHSFIRQIVQLIILSFTGQAAKVCQGSGDVGVRGTDPAGQGDVRSTI